MFQERVKLGYGVKYNYISISINEAQNLLGVLNWLYSCSCFPLFCNFSLPYSPVTASQTCAFKSPKMHFSVHAQ